MPTATASTLSTVMQSESTLHWLLSSDLSALNSKFLTLATMRIELNELHRQLINVPELWYLTYLIFYHQKQHFSSSEVSGKLSIILFARLPPRSLETKPSMDLNYDEHQ